MDGGRARRLAAARRRGGDQTWIAAVADGLEQLAFPTAALDELEARLPEAGGPLPSKAAAYRAAHLRAIRAARGSATEALMRHAELRRTGLLPAIDAPHVRIGAIARCYAAAILFETAQLSGDLRPASTALKIADGLRR